MAIRNVVLHAGAYKTGTTTLQVIANRNREALAAAGVRWIETGSRRNTGSRSEHSLAHHLLAHHVEKVRKGEETEKDFGKMLSEEFRSSDCETALISTELLSSRSAIRNHADFLRLLGWPEMNVRVEFFVRLPEEFIESMQCQMIRAGKTATLRHHRAPFLQVAASFLFLVGEDNFRLRYFSKRRGPDNFVSFFSDLGAGATIASDEYTTRENDSLSVEGHRMRQYVFERCDLSDRKRYKRLMLRLSDLEQGLVGARKFVLFTPEERQKIRDDNRRAMQAVAALLPEDERAELTADMAAPVSSATPNAEMPVEVDMSGAQQLVKEFGGQAGG